mgnify:CR=1 FL=1
MKTIIFDPISDEALNYAYENLDEVVRWDDVSDEDLKNCDSCIIRVFKLDKEMIDKMPNLKIIAKHGVGTDSIDLDYAKSKGIRVTNTPAANSNSVAELIVGLAMAVSRKVIDSYKMVIDGVDRIAPPQLTGFELTGKTFGTIGLGNIGSIASNIFINGFSMKVLVYDPYISESKCNQLGLIKVDKLEDLLKEADIINISVPLTESTENMISKNEFNLMKENAILINTARGKIVNESDLYNALKENSIFGAAMDAFEVEPINKDNPLLDCSNFIATPHNGANTVDSLIRMGTGAVDEIMRTKNGEENLHIVI